MRAANSDCAATPTVTGTTNRLIIEAPNTADALVVGGSASVSSACLSVVELGNSFFCVEVSPHRSTLAGVPLGGLVSPGVSVQGRDRLDGHLVHEHVDAVDR